MCWEPFCPFELVLLCFTKQESYGNEIVSNHHLLALTLQFPSGSFRLRNTVRVSCWNEEINKKTQAALIWRDYPGKFFSLPSKASVAVVTGTPGSQKQATGQK